MRLGELAERLGAALEPSASADRALLRVGGLSEAEPDTLSFLANARYRRHLQTTQAGAVLLRATDRAACPPGVSALVHPDPYTAFARAAALLHPQPAPVAGIDPAAWVHESAVVEGARIEAFAWVGPGAVVGPGSWLEAGAVVGPGARVGRACRLMAHSVVAAGCTLGDRVWLNPGAVVGGEGFGFAPGPTGHTKVPQLGAATIEDDVEIGVHSAVDRATLPGQHTRVGAGARLDNFVQIGHGAEVGPHSLLVAYSGLAGSARIGAGTVLAAKAAVMGHLELGAGVRVAASSLVVRDAPAGATLAGAPAIDHARWLAQVAAAPELAERLREVERRLAALERRAIPPTEP